MIVWAHHFSNLIFLSFIVGIPLYAAWNKKDVFDDFVVGAKSGFETAIKIMPYLIAMFVAIGMLRASGFFDLMRRFLSPILEWIGMPSDLLPLALIRPFSGAASTGLMADIIHEHGGDALISKMAATMMGSTETTFYVIAIYFGAIGIKKMRHAVLTGLIADLAGIIASVIICRVLFS
jgi:spore maturation protein B